MSCAHLDRHVHRLGNLFKGNTKKEFTDYNLKERQEYRHYQYLKDVNGKEKQKEILNHLDKAKIKVLR